MKFDKIKNRVTDRLDTLSEKVTEKLFNWYDGLYPKQKYLVDRIFLTSIILVIVPVVTPYLAVKSFFQNKKRMSTKDAMLLIGNGLKDLPKELRGFYLDELEEAKAEAKKDSKLSRGLK